MALTLRSNGTSGGIVSAAWWNDYYDLLTGAMSDQPVTLKTDVTIQGIANPPGAPTLALAAGTALGVGSYQYAVSFKDAQGGETVLGTTASISTTSGNQAVNLSAIPTGPSGTTQRRIYRTKVGGSTFFAVYTLTDNTTTTYSDTVTDANLGSGPSAHSSMGGLFIKDANGTLHGQIYNDGAISFDGGLLWSDGSGHLNARRSTFMSESTGNGDTLYFYNGHDTSYWVATGVGDSTSGFGVGLWAYDEKAQDFIFKQATPSGITFKGVVGAGGFSSPGIGNASGVSFFVDTANLASDIAAAKVANTAQSLAFNCWDGAALHTAFSVGGAGFKAPCWVDNNGEINSPGFVGPILTIRNGTSQVNHIFTGTNTPANPVAGDIWIKA